jgi:hypothetical protein
MPPISGSTRWRSASCHTGPLVDVDSLSGFVDATLASGEAERLDHVVPVAVQRLQRFAVTRQVWEHPG